MTFRAALGAVPGASPWKNVRNWNGRVGPGSPGLAQGQVGAKRAKMEGPRASEAGFGFADEELEIKPKIRL